MKKSFREIANRINGFEVPIFGGGVSWNPPSLEIEVARGLITYLEDRRALYNPYWCETADYVIRSILDIRERLTTDLENLDPSSSLAKSIRVMRSACRSFLDKIEANDSHFTFHRPSPFWDTEEREFFMALGELRSTMGILIAQIAVRFGIDVEENLATIFPDLPSA